MTVLILAAISGAITTIMLMAFRVNDSNAADSLANSQYAQVLNTWFPADVQSAEPDGSFGTASVGAADTGCVRG